MSQPAAPPPVDDVGDPALAARLREEIEAGGPITFARFMERALYEPELGYYATSTERTTPGGDFVTAPELHPIFGWTLARQVDEMWRHLGRPDGFVLREYGAGSGALILSVLEGLMRIESLLAETLRFDPVELPAQRARILDRMTVAGHAARLLAPGELPAGSPITGVVVANEFLDALPVHRMIRQGGELRELYVDIHDGGFVEVAGEPSNTAVQDWFLDAEASLPEGHQAEVNLGLLDWIDVVEAELERGYVIAIDYGADSHDLYGPARVTGTVRAFAAQHVSSDVLHGVGRRDITAHVDFGALERAARAAGLDALGRRKLNEFLIAAGLDDAYAAARTQADNDWDSALLLRAAVRRLLDPGALGGYLVAVLGKNVPEELALAGLQPLKRHGDAS